jgi:hypothetical protein
MPRRFTAHASANAGLKRKANDPVYENRVVRQLVKADGLGNKRDREVVSAVETKTHLMLAISNENTSRLSTDGSTFTLPLERSNLKIPSTAFNVNARLVDVVVPYTWPNLSNTANEKLLLEIEDEVRYQLVEHTGYTASDYATNTNINALFSGVGSGTHTVGYDGAGASDDGVLTVSGTDLLTEDNYSSTYNFYRQEIVGSDIASARRIALDAVNTEDFVFHIVWEEKALGASDTKQTYNEEVIIRTRAFDVLTRMNTSTGERELILDVYQDDSGTHTEFTLSSNYQVGKTNVLTILYNYEASASEEAYILYNDVLIANGTTFSQSAARTSGGIYAGTEFFPGSVTTARTLYVAFVSHLDTPTTLSLGEARTSGTHWFNHGFLVNALKGTFVFQPHVKIVVDGLDAADGTNGGTVISIPILHDGDNDLTFSTLPTLLGYMQRIMNQYVFREFYFSDFLSVDLIENPVNTASSGADYLIQFDYDLSRASSVAALSSSYNLQQYMYGANGHKMEIEMSPAPYYLFPSATAPNNGSDHNLIHITFDAGTTHNYYFDIEDLDAVVSARHGGSATARGAIAASREDIAHFVYDSIRAVFDAEDYTMPSSWDSYATQHSDSPIDRVERNTSMIEGMDSTATGGSAALNSVQYDYRIVFKDKSTFKTKAGVVTEPTTFNIDLSGLGGARMATDDTDRVAGTYSDASTTFTDKGNVADHSAGNDIYVDVFADIDTLKLTLSYETGTYNADYFEVYTNEMLNEYFMSSTHGLDGQENLFKTNRNQFSQEIQLGFLCGREDPVLPNEVKFFFPGQTATTRNGIAQMLFSGTTLDLDGSGGSTDLLAVYASGSDVGYEYHPPVEGVVSNLLARPTFNSENCQSVTVDYSRVHSSLAGTKHTILPRDERTRIFTVNPFQNDTDTTGDFNTVLKQIEIEIPSGSYSPETLTQEINYQLYANDSELARDILLVRELAPQQKVQIGALVSSNPNNNYPHKVTIKTADLSANPPTKFASLIGWDLTSDIVLEAPDYRVVTDGVQYALTTALQNVYNFKTRQILVKASFVQNSTAPDGQSRQILAAFAPRVSPGENIIFNPNVPIVTSVKGYLTGDKAAEFLRFELLDASTNLPLEVGQDNPWSVQFMIEWQVQIKQSQIQTQANQPNTVSGF